MTTPTYQDDADREELEDEAEQEDGCEEKVFAKRLGYQEE